MNTLGQQRLDAPWGLLIDRNRVVQFEFNGKQYTGLAGDTLASALAANGVRLLSRSFKYHRPRGAWSFSGLDANAYVQLGDRPNTSADQVALYDGLSARAQNVWGSLENDMGSLAGWIARFMPVGFYYRAFFRPRGAWKFWEPLIRRSAGLGKININTPHRHSEKQYLFADVAVIGAGPAGMEAALAAADKGADVLLIDDGAELGGSLNYARFQRTPDEIRSFREKLLAQVGSAPNIRVMNSTTCYGFFADNWLALADENRLYKLRAREVILCTGSAEQPAVFRNNDLPGVLPASGTQRLMRLYGVSPGKRCVILCSNREGYDVANDLLDAAIELTAVIDLNTDSADAKSAAHLQQQGVAVFSGCLVSEAVAGPGRRTINAVVVRPIDGSEKDRTIPCDTLITSVGYSPLAQLLCHSGGRMVYDPSVHSFRPENIPSRIRIAGSVNQNYALDAVLQDGKVAGLEAAAAAGFGCADIESRPADPDAGAINHPYPIFSHPKGKEFVDFDEDVTIADLENAVADGFDHPELAKRYSTAGMGPSQGRLSSLNAMRIVRNINGQMLDETLATTQRPPYKPMSFGLLAGRNFQPERLTPMHHWHVQEGATMMPAGLWQRPAFYGPAGRRQARIYSEVMAVRENVGLIDVSTLGGIEVRGPDAAEFINRMYTFTYGKQEIGRTRYLLMTDDTGSIIDDGVACRLAEDYFYLTTTTTGADNVYRNMLRRIAEWQLEVDIVNVTSAYAAMNIAGPRSREVVQRLETNIDFSAQAFPYLNARQGLLCGVQVLAMRVGFVGELGYELHVPWSTALSVWEQLVRAGAQIGIQAVGVEAQRILRLEKGHVIVGQDTDGLTYPQEAGMGWAVNSNKGYFVGGPAISHLTRAALSRQLTGFVLQDPDEPAPLESHLVLSADHITGRVTSVADSPTLGRVIGLAYVAPEQAIAGAEFDIKVAQGRRVKAQATTLPFYDPENSRQQL